MATRYIVTKSWVRPYAVTGLGSILLSFFLISSSTTKAQVFNTDLEVHVSGLPSLLARTHDLSDVLPTSLDTILHDRSICCGKNSALEDSVAAADPSSLKDVATKLRGRHLLSDGRPIQVTAEYWPATEVNAGKVIGALTNKNALLMSWNSNLYILYGAVYQWIWLGGDDTGAATTSIHKFLLLDTRYSDARRHVEFNRQTDVIDKIQGVVFVEWKPQ